MFKACTLLTRSDLLGGQCEGWPGVKDDSWFSGLGSWANEVPFNPGLISRRRNRFERK